METFVRGVWCNADWKRLLATLCFMASRMPRPVLLLDKDRDFTGVISLNSHLLGTPLGCFENCKE